MNIITLPPDYKPSSSEEYMNPMQKEYFRQKLLDWKEQLLEESEATLKSLKEEGMRAPDDIDRASAEAEKAFEFRTRDRYRKLISKIDKALDKIEDGSYGFCDETGEPIGIERLDARPIATLSIEAQERHERLEKTYDDDY